MSQGTMRLLTEATSLVQKLKELLIKKNSLANEVEWQHLLALLRVEQNGWQEPRIDKKAIIATIVKIIQSDISASQEVVTSINLKSHIKEELDRLIYLIATSPVATKNADFSDVVKLTTRP